MCVCVCVCVPAHIMPSRNRTHNVSYSKLELFASKSELKKLYLVIMRCMTYFKKMKSHMLGQQSGEIKRVWALMT